MPSLLKTAFLQLNKWAGNEYPKREDFVSDNEKIDAFADDISSQLAQKVSKTGDTMTGNLNVPTINAKTPAYAIIPTETLVTTGFASGWSGTLGYRKTQEGIVIVNISQLLKTSNINTSNEVVYTLPSGFRPTRTVKTANVGVNDVGGAVAGSMVELIIEAGTGSVILRSSGSITANVRQITGTQVSGV